MEMRSEVNDLQWLVEPRGKTLLLLIPFIIYSNLYANPYCQLEGRRLLVIVLLGALKLFCEVNVVFLSKIRVSFLKEIIAIIFVKEEEYFL